MGGQHGSLRESTMEALQDEQLEAKLPACVPPGARMLIFGDSWAEDNLLSEGLFAGVQGWPIHLAEFLHLPIAGNFARGQTETPSLRKQLEVATRTLGNDATWSDLVVVLHSGGNDFIGAEKGYNPFVRGNFWLAHCTWGFRKKAKEVMANLRAFLEALRCLGCRFFIVSELPFTSAVPALSVAQLARVNKRGQWLNACLAEMLQDFQQTHASSGAEGTMCVIQVPEVKLLNLLVAAAGRQRRSLFLRDMFHPTQETHRRLAQAVAWSLAAAKLPADAVG